MAKDIFAVFGDDEVLLHNIKPIKQKGVNIKNVFSPYPVHGLDHALGLKATRLSICSFIYGVIGLGLSIWMTWYMNISDWGMDFGGKPSFSFYKNVPAFVPILFEATIFCAAHGMVLTFFLRSRLVPGVTPFVPDVRMSDDKHVMHVVVSDAAKEEEIRSILLSHGAEEVKYYAQ